MQSKRDFPQILKGAWNENVQGLNVAPSAGQLITAAYDEIDLVYYPSGPNQGQLETVTYKLAGNTVNVLTLSYDISNNLTSVVKT